MKKYKVDSISKFLSILEDNDISNYIYRGQNEPYFSIEASGFRPYEGGWSSDKIYDMEHIQLAFQNRVIGQLSENEKKYFLAFCQHHGIPTNLVDVSHSPLVALFFACNGKSEMRFSLQELIGTKSIDALEKDTLLKEILLDNLINLTRKSFYSPFSQTYMIKKERLLNITDLIVKLEGKSLFEEIVKKEKIAFDLLDLLKTHFDSIDDMILKNWLKNLLNTYIYISEIDDGIMWSENLYTDIKEMLDGLDTFNDIHCEELYKILSARAENLLYSNLLMEDTLATMYTCVLVEILCFLKRFPRKINIDLDIYFTYQPPEIFGRISNQQSFFIYQPYLYTNDRVYDYCELNLQAINPDILVEIDNYSDILNELNLLGINQGTIYGDIDNIAKSILKSSGRLLKV